MCNIAIADHESGAHGNALLAEKSSIQFISVKNAAIGEVHHFKTLMGGIDGGKVEISIPLVDVETMIPIRNERMQKMLFETDLFPKAVLSSELEMAPVMAMASGENLSMTVALDLDLHGVTQTLQAPVRVSRLGDEIHVTTEAPIILNVANFNLADGVERLKTVAALNNISTAVPVTAHLVFSR
ncbi:MAG: YceI family protein [Pseudomonadota bacterium]